MDTANLTYFAYALDLRWPIDIGGNKVDRRRGVLVCATDSEGRRGWGDAAPLDGYGPDKYDEVIQAIATEAVTPSLAFAQDCAHASLKAASQGTSLSAALGEIKRNCLLNTSLIGGQIQAAAISKDSDEEKVAKLKVGRESVQHDVARLSELADAHPSLLIRLDANARWSEAQAREFEKLSARYHDRIEFIEEPWAACFEDDNRESFKIRLAIDESRDAHNWHHADVVVLKPSLMGSIRTTLKIARDLQAARKAVVFSSAYESGVGMCAIASLASLFDGGAVGFGTYGALKTDVGARISAFDQAEICLSNLPDPSSYQPDLSCLTEIPYSRTN